MHAIALCHVAFKHITTLLCAGNDRSVRKWWEVFSPGTSETELQDISRQIMAIYDQPSTQVQPETHSQGETRENLEGQAVAKEAGKTEN